MRPFRSMAAACMTLAVGLSAQAQSPTPYPNHPPLIGGPVTSGPACPPVGTPLPISPAPTPSIPPVSPAPNFTPAPVITPIAPTPTFTPAPTFSPAPIITPIAPMQGSPAPTVDTGAESGRGAAERGSSTNEAAARPFIGDFFGYRFRGPKGVFADTGAGYGHLTPGLGERINQAASARSASMFRIAENDSPLPMDRIYFSANHYHNVNAGATYDTPILPANGGPATTGNVDGRNFNVWREVFGFEKTFLDGAASIGIRVPLIQIEGTDNGSNTVGDISVIGKYALYRNAETGCALTTGLVVTVPTGSTIETFDGDIESVLIQPFVGYILGGNSPIYLQAIHAVVIPTDSRDVTFFSNSVAIGYVMDLGKEGFIRSLTPVTEFHLTTPLNNTGYDAPISVPNLLAWTGGVHVGLGDNLIATLAGTIPLTGPQPYEWEAVFQLNFRF